MITVPAGLRSGPALFALIAILLTGTVGFTASAGQSPDYLAQAETVGPVVTAGSVVPAGSSNRLPEPNTWAVVGLGLITYFGLSLRRR